MKKTLAIALALVMMLAAAIPAFAATTEVPDSKYTGTTSIITEYEDYYYALYEQNATQFDVYSADAFVALANIIKAKAVSNSSFAGKTIKLYCDLVFNEGNAADWATTAPANTWTPIDHFAGIFDGQGHTISGLYYSGTGVSSCVGLFARLRPGAEIKNVGVVNSYFKNTSGSATSNSGATGAIAGRLMSNTSAIIEGCYSDAIIDSNVVAGGIIGALGANTSSENKTSMDTAVKVSKCAFYGSVTVTCETPSTKNFGGLYGAPAAGIVGATLGATASTSAANTHNNVQITDCVNFGTITNNSTYESTDATNTTRNTAAGILGHLDDGAAEITRCLNFGATTAKTENEAPYGNNNALIGEVANATEASAPIIVMTDCYIFTDLNQKLFNCTAQNTYGNPAYTLNGNSVAAGTDAASATGIGNVLLSNASSWTKADSTAVKTTLPFTDTTNWTIRANELPVPTAVATILAGVANVADPNAEQDDNTNDNNDNNNNNENNDNNNNNTNDNNNNNTPAETTGAAATTAAATTAAPEATTAAPEEKGGCGSSIGVASLAVLAVAGGVTFVAAKKKED